MHGVSDPFVNRGFSMFGFAPYTPVKEQQFPDADFPTVRFPNPEEKGRQFHVHVLLFTDIN
jgi:phosphoglucomutase